MCVDRDPAAGEVACDLWKK